jgi:hypothetical protein
VRLAAFCTLYQSHPLRAAGIIEKCGGVGRAIIAANNIADPANLTAYKELILPHCMRPATCANGTYPDETLGYDDVNTVHVACCLRCSLHHARQPTAHVGRARSGARHARTR